MGPPSRCASESCYATARSWAIMRAGHLGRLAAPPARAHNRGGVLGRCYAVMDAERAPVMPSATPRWSFGPFVLDPANACLWHRAETVPLPPKVFDVLSYLVRPPERLVTKEELLHAVWPETAVSDAVVRVA